MQVLLSDLKISVLLSIVARDVFAVKHFDPDFFEMELDPEFLEMELDHVS